MNLSPALPFVPASASFTDKIRYHLRRGTAVDRVLERFGYLPEHVRVRWRGADSEAQAVRALARWARLDLVCQPAGSWVMSLGDEGTFHQALNEGLRKRGLSFRSHKLADLGRLEPRDVADLRGIVCGLRDARQLTLACRAVARHPLLVDVPFEYAAGINPERAQFARQDEYPDTHFVAPSLLDQPTPHQIYDESLRIFERKTGLRDYLDLYQMLRHVVANNVAGDIAEFGSYRGQSGWLIARTLQALKSERRVFMFDMFEEFPAERYGVDLPWNRSHQVDFAEVRRRLAPFPNVSLVKGDITETFAGSGVGDIALAFIDCDSYRATRYLLGALWDRLRPGGVLVVEDYGHAALLGSRAAVHEELDGRTGCIRYFSQFSGLYIVIRT